MAGYSRTPLLKKLGIKEGMSVRFVNAPPGFEKTLGEMPEGARLASSSRAGLDFILVFVKTEPELRRRLSEARTLLSQNGMIWIAWPKKSSGVKTHLSFAEVQEAGLAAGVVDTKVCAIDDVWSGLKFVIRLKDRAAGG
ncbi:MAG TPA: DUF3052 family protein [Pyrinomonadaceae bacterium]